MTPLIYLLIVVDAPGEVAAQQRLCQPERMPQVLAAARVHVVDALRKVVDR